MTKKPSHEVIVGADSGGSYIAVRPKLDNEEFEGVMAKLGRPTEGTSTEQASVASEVGGATELYLGKLSTSQVRSKAEMVVEYLQDAHLVTDEIILTNGPDIFKQIEK